MWAYDIEVFRDFFCVTFKSIENNGDIRVFIISPRQDDTEGLIEFLNTSPTLIGYNNLHYDGAVLYYIYTNAHAYTILDDISALSSKLISDDSRFDGAIRKLRFSDRPWKEIDLMKILAFDKRVSLKQTGINLKWKRIQDLPFHFSESITPDKQQIVLDYNLNDVEITIKLYEAIKPLIELRKELSILFNADLINASDSKMANVILEEVYKRESNVDINAIRNSRTKHNQLLLGYCIAANIEFQTNKLKRLKRIIENTLVTDKKGFGYKKSIEFGGVHFELGIGGLHSEDDPKRYVSDDRFLIRDCDVASFYPNIILKNKIKPAHLGEDFLRILQKITEERLAAKKSGDKIRADGLKITINSIFGKLGSETFWLEDAKAMLSVTVSGQLYLLMLIEDLVLNGIVVISANTDGVVCKIPREKEDAYFDVCNKWQTRTGFELEYTDYTLYVRSDVNNYVTKKNDGKTKEKGRYIREIDLKKGYKHPIVARAMYEFLVNGKPVKETIESCRDIMDFCISQKTGEDFVLENHKDDSVTQLQKNNRFYISNSGGKLIKRHTVRNNEIGLFVEENCRILNDFDERVPFEYYDVKFEFYEKEALKYIDKIVDDNTNSVEFIDDDTIEVDSEIISADDDIEREEILLKLQGMKGLPARVVNSLLRIKREFSGENFFELLVYCEENGMLSEKFSDLIKVNYFETFGKNKSLFMFFNEFRKGENRYSAKLSEKSKSKRLAALQDIWSSLKDESFSLKEQVLFDMEILGRVSTKFSVNPRYVIVEKTDTHYSPKLQLYSLANGTSITVKVQKRTYEHTPVTSGTFLFCNNFTKKNSVRKTDFGWEEIPDKYDWWLDRYSVVEPERIEFV